MPWGIEQYSYSIIAIAGKKNVFMVKYMVTLTALPDGEFVNYILELWVFLQKLCYKTPLSLLSFFFFCMFTFTKSILHILEIMMP